MFNGFICGLCDPMRRFHMRSMRCDAVSYVELKHYHSSCQSLQEKIVRTMNRANKNRIGKKKRSEGCALCPRSTRIGRRPLYSSPPKSPSRSASETNTIPSCTVHEKQLRESRFQSAQSQGLSRRPRIGRPPNAISKKHTLKEKTTLSLRQRWIFPA